MGVWTWSTWVYSVSCMKSESRFWRLWAEKGLGSYVKFWSLHRNLCVLICSIFNDWFRCDWFENHFLCKLVCHLLIGYLRYGSRIVNLILIDHSNILRVIFRRNSTRRIRILQAICPMTYNPVRHIPCYSSSCWILLLLTIIVKICILIMRRLFLQLLPCNWILILFTLLTTLNWLHLL